MAQFSALKCHFFGVALGCEGILLVQQEDYLREERTKHDDLSWVLTETENLTFPH